MKCIDFAFGKINIAVGCFYFTNTLDVSQFDASKLHHYKFTSDSSTIAEYLTIQYAFKFLYAFQDVTEMLPLITLFTVCNNFIKLVENKNCKNYTGLHANLLYTVEKFRINVTWVKSHTPRTKTDIERIISFVDSSAKKTMRSIVEEENDTIDKVVQEVISLLK